MSEDYGEASSQPERRCICRHLFSVHGPSGCHAVMTITPVPPDDTGRVRCDCARWPPEADTQPSLVELDAYGSTREEREFQRAMESANDRPPRCTDPDCDGEFGHDGPHFAWSAE